MNIVADENIPLLTEFFGDTGDIYAYPGRSINSQLVTDADVLLVRSVTPVNEVLLKGSSVKFVGTTTIGLDHIDTDYLQQQGIGFCSAPGCNAGAVVEYVLSVLSVLTEQYGFGLLEKTMGIVGYGEIGSRLAQVLREMGMQVKANDPPRQAAGENSLTTLSEVMACDIVSIHVPLTDTGPWPTRELINAEQIQKLQRSQILINTSRGDVMDEEALLSKLSGDLHPTVVLDVFRHEPEISKSLAERCQFATPHIAGYSLEGKHNGTEMVYRQFCRYAGLPVRYSAADFAPEPALKKMVYSSGVDVDYGFNTAVRAAYDVRTDDANLRKTLFLSAEQRSLAFDQLRKNYRVRRGFNTLAIEAGDCHPSLIARLTAAGFRLNETL